MIGNYQNYVENILLPLLVNKRFLEKGKANSVE
jgi:hypothetical protein